MEKNDIRYQTYINILKEELVPAFGCTEPIALAYAAAKARQTLGALPDRVLLQVSGSIIKNVKSVIVPNTGHLKGMPAAAAAGIIAGDPDRELEVISRVPEEKIKEIREFLENVRIDVEHIDNGHVFDIIVTEYKGDSSARVRILDTHTNIVRVEKDGKVLYEKSAGHTPEAKEENASSADRSLLNMEDIWDFITTVDVADISDILDRQIQYNSAIAEEGLRGDYGANIGTVLLRSSGNDIATRAKAWAAAGSDARMNGCELPVIINSGSGNQGITCSVPLIEYARELNSDHETLCTPITKLSAAPLPSPIWWPSTRRPASAPSPPTAELSAPEQAQARVSLTSAAGITRRSSTLWSMRLPSLPALSATAPRHPAQLRLHSP